MRQWRIPNSRWGWHKYYVNRFNKNQHPDAEHLAMFYLMSHLAHEEEDECTKELSSPAAANSADVVEVPQLVNA